MSSKTVEPQVAIDDDVRVEITIAAAPETIFPLLTEPDRVKQWMGLESEQDPRPGGIYRNRVTAEHTSRGEFIEVDPPRRVAFTFGWEGEGQHVPAGSTTVAIDLIPHGTETLVRLTHSGLPSEGTKPDHAEGWSGLLTALKVAAEGSSS
jgi:uncharacterized protein YndB with AHSA1/START domain